MHYELNGKMVPRIIGIKRMLASHTGAYIAKTLQESLKRFSASVDDMFAICTDNGANMLRASSISRLFQSHLLDEFFLNDLPFHDREQAYGIFIDRELKKHAKEINNPNGKYAFSIHCAAHTMELGVKDGLKQSTDESGIIDAARDVIKKLRNESIMNLIALKRLPKPFIDTPTRWSSVYMMLKSLAKLRSLCEELSFTNADFKVPDNFWTDLTDISSILKHPADALQSLQRQNLVLSDVYGVYTNCCLYLGTYEHNLAKNLLKEIKTRSHIILKTLPMYSCMFLDPRFQCALDPLDKEEAKKFLIRLYQKIQSDCPIATSECLDNNDTTCEYILLDDSISLPAVNNVSLEENNRSLLEKMLNDKCNDAGRSNTKTIEILLEEFDFSNQKRLESGASVLEYWVNVKDTRPELYKIASILFAVPPTDVISERNFSTLNFILNKYRNSLSDKSLEQILFIKLNKDVFQEI